MYFYIKKILFIFLFFQLLILTGCVRNVANQMPPSFSEKNLTQDSSRGAVVLSTECGLVRGKIDATIFPVNKKSFLALKDGKQYEFIMKCAYGVSSDSRQVSLIVLPPGYYGIKNFGYCEPVGANTNECIHSLNNSNPIVFRVIKKKINYLGRVTVEYANASTFHFGLDPFVYQSEDLAILHKLYPNINTKKMIRKPARFAYDILFSQ